MQPQRKFVFVMTETINKIKPDVRALKAYTLRPDRASIKINQNENPWDAPERIRQETLAQMSARPWSRYPDFVPAKLQQRLAEFANWTADGVIAGNGSNELIQAVLMVTISSGARVLICEPTFALYRQITTILGGEIFVAPMKQDLTFDIAAISHAVQMFSPDVTIICSPNNPTGQTISDEHLRRLLQEAKGLVVVDEAYHEFAGHSVVPLLGEHENLIVLRTFSKAMALAGLRVGYLLASPLLTNEIRKALLPYNLNAFSQIAAEVVTDNYDRELRPLVTRIIDERTRLLTELSQIDGLVPLRSQANFMIVRSSREPKSVCAELLQRDILVRDVSAYPMLKSHFRVTVGRPDENVRLVAALREIFKG
jgi:histidinol-phosphate aminotransferase